LQSGWQAARHFRWLARQLIRVFKIGFRINEQAVFLDKVEQFQAQKQSFGQPPEVSVIPLEGNR